MIEVSMSHVVKAQHEWTTLGRDLLLPTRETIQVELGCPMLTDTLTDTHRAHGRAHRSDVQSDGALTRLTVEDLEVPPRGGVSKDSALVILEVLEALRDVDLMSAFGVPQLERAILLRSRGLEIVNRS
jgi:hypothetical protein